MNKQEPPKRITDIIGIDKEIVKIRNEYAFEKNRSFDKGLGGEFRSDYTEWMERKIAKSRYISHENQKKST